MAHQPRRLVEDLVLFRVDLEKGALRQPEPILDRNSRMPSVN
jgi:hypothetical protein